MPLPSFYRSAEPASAWNVVHAACYGAIIGALAALFRTVGPFRAGGGAGNLPDYLMEIAAAALAFAVLCAAAAALRNFIARRLIWHEGR